MSECQMQWNPQVARRMADHIHEEVRDMVGNSRLVRKADNCALVQREELVVGELLGKGAFSEVHEVRLVKQKSKSYAMKHLKLRLMTQPDNFRLAAAELAVEAHMLASFDHPNIMKIRGWAANGVASFTTGRHDSFFLLLDKLEETLDQRICLWQQFKEQNQDSNNAGKGPGNLVGQLWRSLSNRDIMDPPQEQQSLRRKEEHMYLEQLSICTDVAAALGYLHEKGVIFRDLKPNNIGFLDGRVQLFDFGLSRELPEQDLTTPFEMSGKVGTLRYMAVEVACHKPYNVSADVYSWAMVSYEVLTLQKPYSGWTRDMHSNLVCGKGVRPESGSLAPQVRTLLEGSWDQQSKNRPSMSRVCEKMRMLEEQQLLVTSELDAKQEEGGMVVELPTDFSVGRKPPSRAHSALSEAFTRSTISSFSDAGSSELYVPSGNSP